MRHLVLVAAVAHVAAAYAALPFKAGERVVFLGDSITRLGNHLRVVEDYVLTRYPGVDIRFRNAGVGGDTASACVGRIENDVTAFSPAWITVMFGMNDISRSNYVADPTQQQIDARNRALATHKTKMTSLRERLATDNPGASLVWCTPSPYDEGVVYAHTVNVSVGANAALGECATFVRGLASANGDRLVEFYTAMNECNEVRQRTDRSFTLCGTDRIHPGKAGGLFMGWRYLKDMGADALVSSVTVDAQSGACVSAANATVTGVEKLEQGVRFTIHENALPFPVDPEAAKVAETLPLAEDLNSEIVQVTGLGEGMYALAIDGDEVAWATGAEWAAGVNLAFNKNTPQFRLAARISERNAARNQNESDLRILHMIRWWLGRQGITNVDDFDEIRGKTNSLPQTGFYAEHIPMYLEQWPQHQQLWQAVEDEWTALVAMAKTVPHEYAVTKVVKERPEIVTEGPDAVKAFVSPSTGEVVVKYRLIGQPAVITATIRVNGEIVPAATE